MALRGGPYRMPSAITSFPQPRGTLEETVSTQDGVLNQVPQQGPPQEEVQPPYLNPMLLQPEILAYLTQILRQETSVPTQPPVDTQPPVGTQPEAAPKIGPQHPTSPGHLRFHFTPKEGGTGPRNPSAHVAFFTQQGVRVAKLLHPGFL